MQFWNVASYIDLLISRGFVHNQEYSDTFCFCLFVCLFTVPQKRMENIRLFYLIFDDLPTNKIRLKNVFR